MPSAHRVLPLLAVVGMLSSGCGAIVSGGMQADQVKGGQAVIDEANERVAGVTAPSVGRIPAATGDCQADTAAVTALMTSLPGRSALDPNEAVALARLEGLVQACGGRIDPQLQARFDAA